MSFSDRLRSEFRSRRQTPPLSPSQRRSREARAEAERQAEEEEQRQTRARADALLESGDELDRQRAANQLDRERGGAA